MTMADTLAQAFGQIFEGIDSGFGVAGACDVFAPEVIYVKQGQKAWFALGESTQLNESLDESVNIVESFDDLELNERVVNGKPVKTVKDGVWLVEGPFQRSDTKNANGRTYRRTIWERLVGDDKSSVQEVVRSGGMVGHLEHPADGRMNAKEGALVTRKLTLKNDGVVWGVAELLDTPNGLILQEYTRKGVRWGVSSRGNGSVDDKGFVNEEDYSLSTFDAVLKPSTPGAYPKRVNSGKEESENAGGTPELTEAAEEVISEVKALSEGTVEGLDESGRMSMLAELVGGFSRVGSLASSGGLSDEKAVELQNWLARKLRSLHEAWAVSLDGQVDDILDELEDGTDDAGEHLEVIERLQAQAEESAEEAASLRIKLEEAEARLEQSEGQLALMEAERDEAREALDTNSAALQEAEKQLAIATRIISDQSEAEVEDLKAAAIDEAIERVPQLAEVRDMLEKAEDADEVNTLAERLLPMVVKPKASTTPISSRHIVPRGAVVESAVKGGPGKPAMNPSQGARIAGRALGTRKS
jgi:hypothetical protein